MSSISETISTLFGGSSPISTVAPSSSSLSKKLGAEIRYYGNENHRIFHFEELYHRIFGFKRQSVAPNASHSSSIHTHKSENQA
ncbi:hypothetical protein NPIL_677291 [Nephila pilipes]|nr:hypothetical protein NPIL_677291 [Nephila pilipes]